MTRIQTHRDRLLPSTLNRVAHAAFSPSGWYTPVKTHVAIFGGGAGGVSAALELADSGYQVTIYERNRALLQGSSNATPGRAGHGYHYLHAETGKLYLRATIEVVRRFPECMLGYNKGEDHYLKHGLYFIMKMKKDLGLENERFASQHPAESILVTYELLREEYAQLIADDPKNKVFGEPNQFFKIEDKQGYESIVDTTKVAMVVNTREELLNWPKLRGVLIALVNEHPNIHVDCDTTVRSPRYRSGGSGFCFYANERLVYADYIVNSTWEEMEYLNHQMGFLMPPDSRTNRLKTIITIKLPPVLTEQPSMFFCMGPHAMFSNMGDGRGMATYAPETNLHASTALQLAPEAKDCLDKKQSLFERNTKAQRVLSGVAEYMPVILKSEIIDMGFGIIKTHGTVDISDPNSDFHKRDYLGVEEKAIGWIDNACMKLLYFLNNGRAVKTLIVSHQKAEKSIDSMSSELMNELAGGVTENTTDLTKMFSIILFRNFSSRQLIDDYSATRDQIRGIVTRKKILNNAVITFQSPIQRRLHSLFSHDRNIRYNEESGRSAPTERGQTTYR